MNRTSRAVVIVALVATVLTGGPAAGSAGVDRLYFLNAPGGTAYYSSDAADPEAAGGSLSQRCNIFLNPQTTRLCQFTFMPAVELAAPLAWSPDAPLRFHAELDPQAVADATVTFFVQSGTAQTETPPATEVSPGIWEAALTTAGKTSTTALTMLGVRVRATGPTVAMVLRTRGRSWVDLPTPIPGRSVGELMAQSPSPTEPNVYVTGQRTFRFADRSWQAWQMQGNLAANATYDVTLPAAASAVYAWTEHAKGPWLHATANGQTPDPRWLTDVPAVQLRRNGEPFGDGGNESRAAADVPAGTFSVEVTRSPAARDKPYVLHVVAVHGARTLRALRWQTAAATSAQAGLVAACPHTFDPLVVPSAASTFSVALSWSSLDPTDRWALAYDLPTVGSVVCGDQTSDPSVRFVVPRATRLWLFEPRITTQQPNATATDVVFEFEAQLAYTPQP